MNTIIDKRENNLNIDINWFILLSNKLDNYFDNINLINDQLKDLKNNINTINEQIVNFNKELEIMKALHISNIELAQNTNNNTNTNLDLIKTALATTNAKLNDQSLNLAYLDDKVTELVSTSNDQFSQIYDFLGNAFPNYTESTNSSQSNQPNNSFILE